MTSARTGRSARTALAALTGVGALACAGLALAAPASASTPANTDPTPTAQQRACDKAPWAARVQGRPKGFGAGSTSGDYLWHDAGGFHLRVTHGHNHDGRVYSGEIHSGQPMRLEPVRLEGNDSVALSSNRKTISFSFENHGRIDGIDFHSDCARALTVSHLRAGDHALPVGHVDLGYYEAHPSHVPFTVHRYGGPS